MQVIVHGGTSAGWKRILMLDRIPWTCGGCGKQLAYYWRSCPNCGSSRPH